MISTNVLSRGDHSAVRIPTSTQIRRRSRPTSGRRVASAGPSAPRTAPTVGGEANSTWFIFALSLFLLLGIGVIGAIAYVILLG